MTVSNVAGTGATVSECGAEGTAATTAAIAQTSTFVSSTTEDLQLTPTASSTAAVKIQRTDGQPGNGWRDCFAVSIFGLEAL